VIDSQSGVHSTTASTKITAGVSAVVIICSLAGIIIPEDVSDQAVAAIVAGVNVVNWVVDLVRGPH
jgi:hypothetical protein